MRWPWVRCPRLHLRGCCWCDRVTYGKLANEARSCLEYLDVTKDVASGLGPTNKDSQRPAVSPCHQTVRARGVEPPLSCENRNLNPARLPVPPRPRLIEFIGNPFPFVQGEAPSKSAEMATILLHSRRIHAIFLPDQPGTCNVNIHLPVQVITMSSTLPCTQTCRITPKLQVK